MDRITELEGIGYFFMHAEDAGVIAPTDAYGCDLYAIHSLFGWDKTVKNILDKIRYRCMIDSFKYVKTTKMNNGKFNHIFKVII